MPPPPQNIARHLSLMAASQPAAIAIKIPRGRLPSGAIDYLTLTFAELHTEVTAWQQHLAARGVCAGDRTLVMVRQGLPLIAAVFALFRLGAVPVIIDPGMGLKSFLRCVAHSRPRVLSRVCWRAFRSVEVRVSVSGSPLARAKIPNSKFQIPKKFQIPNSKSQSSDSALAAILFTSGSTGTPKGVCYEHAMFEAQIRAIRAIYDIAPGERDLSMLPIFALFAPALGMTTIVPELDPSRPATLDPAKIVQAIQQEQVTNSFGSPTLWNKIADYCLAHNITLPTLRRVLCAGAPVPASLWEKARKILPNGQLHSPYGATECLPVSTISGDEIKGFSIFDSRFSIKELPLHSDSGAAAPNRKSRIENRKSFGACVGRATPEIQIKIISITDTPIATLADARELPHGEIGEIIVTGPAVTREYDNLPEATAAAKIMGESPMPPDPSLASVNSAIRNPHSAFPVTWHRMGDTGYLDADGRLWFCGRKAERVETASGTLYTEPCEQVFRAHSQVARCALIGLGERGSQIPAIVVQPANKNLARPEAAKLADEFAAELRALAQAHPHTQQITRFYFHPNFPVDVRHNAKIHRLTLAKWAATQTPAT